MFLAQEKQPHIPKPSWLRRKLPTGAAYEQVRSLIRSGALHTICQEAKCPNQWECFSAQTAAFLIMGPLCTRSCHFCAVEHGSPEPPDPKEPARVADTAQKLGLCHVVVTSVTRDDLPDGGASFFAATVKTIRERIPEGTVEVLIPDFQGDAEALHTVINARPDVLNHNIETVPRLYATVRPEAAYDRSIELLRRVKKYDPSLLIKSGLMLGLGETFKEIEDTLQTLLAVGCRLLTLGQYLQPSAHHLQVKRFVPPEEFDRWRAIALKMGFSQVASGPFVRSSYRAPKN